MDVHPPRILVVPLSPDQGPTLEGNGEMILLWWAKKVWQEVREVEMAYNAEEMLHESLQKSEIRI